jgi:hypothetical protein
VDSSGQAGRAHNRCRAGSRSQCTVQSINSPFDFNLLFIQIHALNVFVDKENIRSINKCKFVSVWS